jgi:hypothetical protein
MAAPKYKRNKKPCIKIFQNIETETGPIKKYIHPNKTLLNAYVRQLSAREQNVGNAEIDGSTIEFTVNKRSLSGDMFVEFKGEVYQIAGVDNFEFLEDADISFQAYRVNPKDDYIEIQYTEWS